MTELAAVLFDLDDTLVAFDAVTEASWRRVTASYCEGRALDPQALYLGIKRISDWYWSDAGRHREGRLSMGAARQRIVAEAFRGLGLPEGDAAGVADRYARVRLQAMYLLPGAAEALDALRGAGVPLALVTNGDAETQRYKIRRFGLEDRFEAILIEGEVGFGKPDPRVFALALERLQVRPQAAVMVGDNLSWDVEAPQRLGIGAVWIDRKSAGLPSGWATGQPAVIPDVSRLMSALRARLPRLPARP